MKKLSMSVVAGALVALGASPAFATSTSSSQPQTRSSQPQGMTSQQQDTGSQQDMQQSGQGLSGTSSSSEGQGVIERVNAKQHSLTIIVPKDVSTTYRQAPGFSEVSHELDMASVRVPVASDAKVMVDGQQSKFSDLKMGDSVRVSFDPQQKKIVNIEATSLQNGQSQGQSGQNMQDQKMQPPQGTTQP